MLPYEWRVISPVERPVATSGSRVLRVAYGYQRADECGAALINALHLLKQGFDVVVVTFG